MRGNLWFALTLIATGLLLLRGAVTDRGGSAP